MITLKLALRTLLRRKSRMILIGLLVAFGTFLVVFGDTVSRSAAEASRRSIIENFTGDFIAYSARSKEKPSPFAFNTPLPNIQNVGQVQEYLAGLPEVEAFVPYAQNYAILQVQRGGGAVELPFIFYAVEPAGYRKIFRNADMRQGDFFGLDAEGRGAERPGVLISDFQNEQYERNYGTRLEVGEKVTILGLSDGGGVNAYPSRLAGIFEPRYYRNVFNYINFIDMATYSGLYNFTGVAEGSLPEGFSEGLERAAADEDSLFELAADEDFGRIDVSRLKSEALSGFTMIAVRLKDHRQVDRVMAQVAAREELGVKVSRWDEASGFFARIASALQAFIWLATALIFLVVVFIFMNTLIINVIERTSEIGTMRAIGGEKGFIRGIFLAETLILNVAFALLAMLAGLAVVLLLGRGGLPLPDTVSQYLIGGGPLPLRPSVFTFLEAILAVVLISVVATVYPIRVATAITPLRAMSDR